MASRAACSAGRPLRRRHAVAQVGNGGRSRWLNSTVLGIGVASLFSDWSHEIATTLLPAFIASIGAAGR